MTLIQHGMREQIAQALPDALDTAIASYQLFSERRIDDDAKEFKAHHDACKVAIAHIELLIKLAQWADIALEVDNEKQKSAAIAALCTKAQEEIKRNAPR